jgi:SAM-dependent methyltransferase
MVELKSFDRVADVYDETRGLPPAVEEAIAEAIWAELTPVAAHPRVVEVGIGTGRIAVPLARRGATLVGTDIASRMLARLLGKGQDIDACLAEGAWPPFRAGSFDAALFVHVLHLVPDVAATVRATLALLRRPGVMIVGRDDEQPGVRDEADQAIRSIVREVAGLEMTGWKPYEQSDEIAARVLKDAGARSYTVRAAEWVARTTAKRHLERLARRDFSSAWEIPDDKLAEVVELAGPALERVYGSWEREREYPRSFSLTVARLG